MAKIEHSHPKQTGGGYERLLGNREMASIFTKAQSTVISNGTELEKIISDRSCIINDLDRFIDDCDSGMVANGTYLCTKKIVKLSRFRLMKHEPDFVAFVINKEKNVCCVIELKDGDAFDTKKSLVEKEMLQLFVNHLAPKISFRIKYYICCFNQMDKEKIVFGLKNVFAIEEVMTGKEFCDLLGIDYDSIVNLRRNDALDNFKYVVEKMFEISDVRKNFSNMYRKRIIEDDFYNVDDSTVITN